MRRALALMVALASMVACGPSTPGPSGIGETSSASEEFDVGEPWGPCPTDELTGVYTLCFSEDTACVPASEGLAAVCLPLDSCQGAPYGLYAELGYAKACYPRCENDSDCADGQLCADAWSDQTLFCAWPT